MVNLIVENKEFIAIIISFIGVVIPLATFLVTKTEQQRQINFELFHNKLMSGLSNQDGKTGLDQQIAIIFELRKYPQYYPVIQRILKYQVNRWKGLLNKSPQFKQLIDEAQITINYAGKNVITRLFSK